MSDQNKCKLRNIVFSIVLMLLSLLAIGFTPWEGTNNLQNTGVRTLLLRNMRNILSPSLLTAIKIIVFLCITYYGKKNIFKMPVFMVSICLSFFHLLGASYEGTATRNYTLFCGSRSAIIYSGILLLSFTVLYMILISFIYNIFDYCSTVKTEHLKTDHHPYGQTRIVHLFIGMMIAWLPYLIIFYPGAVSVDESGQLLQMIGYLPLNDHSPFLLSCLMGLCYRIGCLFGNANTGVFLYTLLQSMTSALIIAYSIWYMQRLKCHKIIRILTFLYFALFPLWGSFMQGVQKDTLFTSLFLLYIILLYDNSQHWDSFMESKNRIIQWIVLSLVMSGFRKTGYYIVLITMVILCVIYRKYLKKMTFILLAIIFIFSCYTHILFPLLDVRPGSTREALSIPFQQTARYVKEYGQEVTEVERQAIDKVLEYQILADSYHTYLSDNVKSTYKEPTKIELLEYMKVWFAQLCKHPGVYIDATVANSYGYWYPYTTPWGYNYFTIYEGERLNIHQVVPKEIRQTVEDLTTISVKAPISKLLWIPGTYTWMYLILIGYFILKKQYRDMQVLIPIGCLLLSCIASPVNTCVRYAMPMMMSFPFVLGIALRRNRTEE